MPLWKAALLAALLSLTARARAQTSAGKADRELTPEQLIAQCPAGSRDQIAARATALQGDIQREIKLEAPTLPAAIPLTRANGSPLDSLTLIAGQDLKTFLEGSTPAETKLAQLKAGCRMVATTDQGWAALGYLQTRMWLADDIKKDKRSNDFRQRVGKEIAQMLPIIQPDAKPDDPCANAARRAAVGDALAFKKLLVSGDDSSIPVEGEALLPLAAARLRCQ